MKRLILAGLGALAVVTTMGSANAADMPRRHTEMPVKAPLYEPPFSWTGFYIGINGGGAWGRSDWSNTLGTNTIDTSGAVVGGTIGYNYQMGQTVFGLEGDGDWSNLRGSTTGGACTGTSCETHNSWLATARGRLGYAFGRFMPYVTGGAAFGDVKATVEREDRISLCRSRQGQLRRCDLRPCDQRQLDQQLGAGRYQLSLLINWNSETSN